MATVTSNTDRQVHPQKWGETGLVEVEEEPDTKTEIVNDSEGDSGSTVDERPGIQASIISDRQMK